MDSTAPRDEAREPVEIWREAYYRVLNGPALKPPVTWGRGEPWDYQKEQALIAAANACAEMAAAPRADSDKIQRRIEELEEALQHYGSCDPGCSEARSYNAKLPCRCGFEAAARAPGREP